MPQYALVDCNNFYVSCERAFNPRLENKPVVVLSNNDGCIISRSNEAKRLNIPMGAPFFKWKAFCAQHQVSVLSSNYELYGDMSQRVMALLKAFQPATEVYSIDEAFLLVDDISLEALTILRNNIKQYTGIPISIGVGQTKTLAKLANQLSKQSGSVFWLNETTLDCLIDFPVGKVWGIGSRLADKLKNLQIDTAFKLRQADPAHMKAHFSVTVEKTVRELNGVPCIELALHQVRKQIISSRSFGKVVTHLPDLEEAVSHYTTIAAKKLRKQTSVTSAIYVFLQTNHFSADQQRDSIGLTFPLSTPTADTRILIHAAKKCVRSLYRKQQPYHKAGVMLLDISQEKTRQYDMLLEVEDPKGERMMRLMDNINQSMGKNTIFIAAEGIKRKWIIRCDKRSPRYTTRWPELPVAFCF